MTVKMRATLLVWAVHFLLGAYGNDVPREEYSKLRRHLKLVNKPAVKSIKTEYGDIFDCVDIYKQHAFDHPLLKNHTIPVTHIPLLNRNKSQSPSDEANFAILDGGCPEGTVPIRRTRMQDLLRAPSIYLEGKKYAPNVNFSGEQADTSHHHWAAIQTQGVGQYYGTKATFNVWSPPLAFDSMFSLSQFWVVAGSGPNLNSIEAGWTVSPPLYGDQVVRMFLYWTSDNYVSKGCYNTLCPGYVHTNQNEPVGGYYRESSTYGGMQYVTTLQTQQDPKSGDWMLLSGQDDVILGYFPRNILSVLGDGPATTVEWGGETFNPTDFPNPPMGSGHFPVEGARKACFAKQLRVVDTDRKLVDAPVVNTKIFLDKPGCYGVVDPKNIYGEGIGRFIYYGGPGGKC